MSVGLTKQSQERTPGAGHPLALQDFPLNSAENLPQLHHRPLLPVAPPVATDAGGQQCPANPRGAAGLGSARRRAQLQPLEPITSPLTKGSLHSL